MAWDGVTTPLATRRDDVPWAPEAITARWLEEVLARPGARVRSVTLGTGSAGSTIRRQLLVEWDEAGERIAEDERETRGGLPRSLLARMTPTWTSRLAYGTSGAAAAESRFFNAIRPELEMTRLDA